MLSCCRIETHGKCTQPRHQGARAKTALPSCVIPYGAPYFIGNLYKQVKDPNLVGSLSGHTEGSKAFARYRDIDEEMKTDLVKLLE